VVVSTLGDEFHIFREVAGESVPVHGPDTGINGLNGLNGLQNNGKEGTGPYRSLVPMDPWSLQVTGPYRSLVPTDPWSL